MLTKTIKITFIAACAAILAGCCYCKEYQRKYGRPLEKTRWTLVQMDGRPVEGNYVLVFGTDGVMTVTADSVTLTSGYEAYETGVLKLEGLTLTGVPAEKSVESRLVEMLRMTTGYKMDGKFVMMIRNGEMWALFEAKDPK